jgi:hypothetical protein
MLQNAAAIVEKSGNSYDAGCLCRAQAKCLWGQTGQGGRTVEVRRRVDGLLSEACDRFRASDRLAEVDAREELAAFRANGRLRVSFDRSK